MEAAIRFDVPFVPVHMIAKQFYCEKQVEMILLRGKPEASEAVRRGREAHERLLSDAISASDEEIRRLIARGEAVLIREMPLRAVFRGVPMAGLADAVFFRDGRPLCLLEHKFGASARPWRDHHVQARAYGLLLHLSGFLVDRLRYALIYPAAEPEPRGREDLEREVVAEALRGGGGVRGKTFVARIYPFDLREAEEDVAWALGFWRGEREAVPTSRAGKCRACDFRTICPNSRAR
jgi:CRISPR/Cas system-associated exonuclease Cas4 (RecB family)